MVHIKVARSLYRRCLDEPRNRIENHTRSRKLVGELGCRKEKRKV
jgi:hypothetical protein